MYTRIRRSESNGRHYILSVSGKKLKICYYDKDEMKISGRLEVIRFE